MMLLSPFGQIQLLKYNTKKQSTRSKKSLMYQSRSSGVLQDLIQGKLCCKKTEQQWVETGLAIEDIENHFRKVKDQYQNQKSRTSKTNECETACTQKSRASSKAFTNVLSISQWKKRNQNSRMGPSDHSQSQDPDFSLAASTIINNLYDGQAQKNGIQNSFNFHLGNCKKNGQFIKASYSKNLALNKNYASRCPEQKFYKCQNQAKQWKRETMSTSVMEESQVTQVFSKLSK